MAAVGAVADTRKGLFAMLYVDIPTLAEFKALRTVRADPCISIYLETTPVTQQIDASRIALRNLAKSAFAKLEAADFDKLRLAHMAEEIDVLAGDDEFWRLQAHSLAVLIAPDVIRTFRLPNRLTTMIQVSDRFHLKPLLRAITFSNSAFVLTLSENAVRLVQVFADLPPREINVPNMPEDASSYVSRENNNRGLHNPRIQGSEGQKMRLAQYVRAVDGALRPVLSGLQTPLILAATQPLSSIFTSINSYPGLLPDVIAQSPDRLTLSELASAARPVLDKAYARDVANLKALYEDRAGNGRATTDLADTARAATFGAVEALLVDIDEVVAGRIDEESGTITYAGEPEVDNYDVIDEIASRALLSGARVLGVRSDDIPGGALQAAVLRYPV